MRIRRLPPLLVNQIAAGEVIERPASVVKELIENAIDAGARRIDVTIEDGGRELVQVRDDGCGIAAEDLPLAVAPHATSKIERAEDLDRIATMGFRGEALASIASVSRLQIISRMRSEPAGAILEAEGETVGHVRPHAGPTGTTIIVRNLFFNTPARRKFLRTEATEASRIAETVESIALAHPHIAFTLKHGERTRLDLPAEDNPRRRVLAVLGAELESQFLEVDHDRTEERGIAIWGMIGLPEIARGSANHQRIYLNGRPIRDRSLQHALKEAYRGLIEPGRYPTLVLFIEMNPGDVDVNVHPAKLEVRFRNQTMVHGTVLGAVRNRLREADLTPRLSFGPEARGQRSEISFDGPPPREFSAGVGNGSHRPITTPRDFVEYFTRLDPKQKGFIYSEVKEALSRETEDVQREIEGAEVEGRKPLPDGRGSDSNTLTESIRAPLDILQVHSSYIVTQDETGLVIIDQHALHERVMFEKLIERIASTGALESQRLLMPEVIECDRAAVDLLDDLKPIFERLGLEAEAMGPCSVAVHAFPSFLFDRGVEIQPFVKDLLERAVNDGLPNDLEAALHETLDMMACKAAIKAGDRLSPEELNELLLWRDRIDRSSNCPHGRPTTLRLSIAELDKQFGRM